MESPSPSRSEAAENIRRALASAGEGLVEREGLLELVALAAVAREHVLVVGPPGTAKSEAVRRVSRALGGRYFEYLLGRFTEPSEIFGPVDLRSLKDGVVRTETAGMLPEAEIAFLDEVFLGSTAILNTLLGILNERRFRRGSTDVACPLRVCVGASNRIPEDDQLAAFGDRFLVRSFVESMPDSRLEDLLSGGWALARGSSGEPASLADLDALSQAAATSDPSAIRADLSQAVRLLRRAGIVLSDRRVVKVQMLIAAAAALAGRDAPTAADLWPIVVAVPTAEGQALARDVLRDLLAASENPSLMTATTEASLGPAARAAQLEAAAKSVLAERPGDDAGQELAAWKLKLEALARTIDAGFSSDHLPAGLATIRATIVTTLGGA